MIYFTGDTHFGHQNILHLCGRPFECVEDMNEFLIAKWNERVRNNDTIFVLGDMFFRCGEVECILSRLRGKKRLLIGNHDTWVKKVDCSRYFQSVDKLLETTDGKHALTLCHYPMFTWNHPRRSYMVHAHTHDDKSADYWPLMQARERVLNAGVDINGFAPVTFDEMLENNRRFKCAE